MNTNLKKLHDLGQSLWVDNISREMPAKGRPGPYTEDRSVTGTIVLPPQPTVMSRAANNMPIRARVRTMAIRLLF